MRLTRLRFLPLFLAPWLASATPQSNATAPAFAPEISALPCPAGVGSSGASLCRSRDGALYLSWLETSAGEHTALKFSRFDARDRRWTAANQIAEGTGWLLSNADFPSLAAAPGGRLAAVWFVKNPGG